MQQSKYIHLTSEQKCYIHNKDLCIQEPNGLNRKPWKGSVRVRSSRKYLQLLAYVFGSAIVPPYTFPAFSQHCSQSYPAWHCNAITSVHSHLPSFSLTDVHKLTFFMAHLWHPVLKSSRLGSNSDIVTHICHGIALTTGYSYSLYSLCIFFTACN